MNERSSNGVDVEVTKRLLRESTYFVYCLTPRAICRHEQASLKQRDVVIPSKPNPSR